MKLDGRVAIVTGGGYGIGRAIALTLAGEGADVVVVDINSETAKGVADQIKAMGRRALAVKTDVSKSKEVNEMVQIVLRDMGKVDILVNNAGGGARERSSEFKDSTEEVWHLVIGRNLFGTLNCSRAVINHMIERRSGKIVNLSSYVALTGGVGAVEYSAAKGGIISFTKSLAKEVGKYNINVNCVAPGIIQHTYALGQIPKETLDKLITAKPVLPRLGEPEDIANAVLFLVSDDASFITGQNYPVCGGSSIS